MLLQTNTWLHREIPLWKDIISLLFKATGSKVKGDLPKKKLAMFSTLPYSIQNKIHTCTVAPIALKDSLFMRLEMTWCCMQEGYVILWGCSCTNTVTCPNLTGVHGWMNSPKCRLCSFVAAHPPLCGCQIRMSDCVCTAAVSSYSSMGYLHTAQGSFSHIHGPIVLHEPQLLYKKNYSWLFKKIIIHVY